MKHIFPALLLTTVLLAGCANDQSKKDDAFHTSGSREADQRASQRIAADDQIRGKGGTPQEQQKDIKTPLYDRIGGESGIKAIVDDFTTRALADPRVNFTRKGTTKGGVLGIGRKSAEWQSDPGKINTFKTHLAQFLSLATGGPTTYSGKPMKQSHQGMNITNAEFDASVGDLKATLENLRVPTQEQKELLAIVETTRTQIVEER